MQLWQIIAGVTLGATLAKCADKSANISTPAFKAPSTAQQGAISQPAVSGAVYIRPRIALPLNAAMTVMLSDATIPDTHPKSSRSAWWARTVSRFRSALYCPLIPRIFSPIPPSC